jgi:hypothetical protein
MENSLHTQDGNRFASILLAPFMWLFTLSPVFGWQQRGMACLHHYRGALELGLQSTVGVTGILPTFQ